MLADRAGVLHHRHPTGQPAGALDRVGRWHRARRHCNGNRQQLRARLTVEGGALTALCAHQREQPSAVVLPPSPLRASATVDREARAQRHRPLHLAPRPTPPHHTPRRTTHTTTTNIVRRAPAPARRTTTEPNHYRGTRRGSRASGLPVSSPGHYSRLAGTSPDTSRPREAARPGTRTGAGSAEPTRSTSPNGK